MRGVPAVGQSKKQFLDFHGGLVADAEVHQEGVQVDRASAGGAGELGRDPEPQPDQGQPGPRDGGRVLQKGGHPVQGGEHHPVLAGRAADLLRGAEHREDSELHGRISSLCVNQIANNEQFGVHFLGEGGCYLENSRI